MEGRRIRVRKIHTYFATEQKPEKKAKVVKEREKRGWGGVAGGVIIKVQWSRDHDGPGRGGVE